MKEDFENNPVVENEEDFGDIINELHTSVSAEPTPDTYDAIIRTIMMDERYFPRGIDLPTLKNPGISLANLNEKEINQVLATLAKVELIELSDVPRHRESDLKRRIEDFEQIRVYLLAHLSLARRGHLLDKITQISKIVSYQANTPQPQKRRLFPFFGR